MAADEIRVSLVIPTYNRSAFLAKALDSVAASQSAGSLSAEVVVVDNNSPDDTRDLVEKRACDTFPFPLRYVSETKQGLSHARNAGLAQARGAYIVFMDDDQLIDADYLARVEPAFEATAADCLGGPIRYYNAVNLPDWLPDLLEHVGQYDAGSEVKTLTPPREVLNGGNMAFHKNVLEAVGGYDVTLGRTGNSLLAGEEGELQDRLAADGYKIVYAPQLVQYHFLDPQRRKKSYWRRHRFDKGRTEYRYRQLERMNFRAARLLGAPRWMWWSLAMREVPRYLRSIFTADKAERVHRQLEIFVMLGRIYEARASRRLSIRDQSRP